MYDQKRGEELLKDAADLEALQLGGVVVGDTLAATTAIAHRIRKYVKLVVDRDAGPSDLVKAESTALRARIEQLEAELVVVTADRDAARAYRPEMVRLTRKNAELKNELAALRKKPVEPTAG